MKGLKNIRCMFFGGIVVSSLFLISCGKIEEVVVDNIKLNSGAIIEKIDDSFKNFNLKDEKYDTIESEDIIGLYDNETGRYISVNNGEYKFFKNGKAIKLDGVSQDVISLKLSPKGKYLTYFENEDGVNNLKIYGLENSEEIEFNSKVFISSTYMDWLDEKNIVYYGISEDRVNGIFIYNVETGTEDVFYKLNGGIVQYIKTLKEGVIYVHETIDNERVLKVIDNSGSNETIISKDIIQVNDIIKQNESYYFLGKVKGDNESLYKISNGKLKRMTFDFPQEIDMEKGLSKSEDGNILFIGKNDKKVKEKQIYKLTPEGAISLLKDSGKDYNFVDINE